MQGGTNTLFYVALRLRLKKFRRCAMLDKELEYTLNLAFKEARAKRHEFVTVEHLLIALLENSAALEVLKACGANISRLRNNLTEFVDRTTPVIPAHIHDRDTQPTL